MRTISPFFLVVMLAALGGGGLALLGNAPAGA